MSSPVGDGVYHAVWNGNGWNPPESPDTRPFDPHGQQLVVCQGNRLHVADDDRTAENEIWYASKITKAPELACVAIPISDAAPTSAPVLTSEPSVTPAASTATPPPSVTREAAPKSSTPSSGRLSPTLIGIASAGLLVIVVCW